MGILVAVVTSVSLNGAIYYVSPTGNNNNNGTSTASPWQTLAKVNSQVLQPADVVRFLGGATFSGTLVANHSGTLASPITYNSYGTGVATISSGNAGGLIASGSQHLRFMQLNFTGSGYTTNTAVGMFFNCNTTSQKSNILIDQVKVSGYGSFGIHFLPKFRNTSEFGYSNVVISNVESFDNKDSGLEVQTAMKNTATYSHSNVTVRDSKFYRNRGFNTPNSSGNGIRLADVNGALIERCVAFQNGLECTATGGGPIGIWSWDSNNVNIQFCEAYENGNAGLWDGGGFDIDGGNTHCIIQYCYSHNNSGAGYLIAQYEGTNRPMDHNIIRYNLSVNDAKDGVARNQGSIHIWNASGNAPSAVQNTLIYGNTVYQAVGPDAFRTADAATTNTRVFNNIFMAANSKAVARVQTTAGISMHSNLYWGSNGNLGVSWGGQNVTSLAAFRSLGQEIMNSVPTGVHADPQFVNPGSMLTFQDAAAMAAWNAYQISTQSPAIDAGLNVPGYVGATTGTNPAISHPGARDFFGNTIPRGGFYDIGAFEQAPQLPTILANQQFTMRENEAFTGQLVASGAPTSWMINSGQLPLGLSLQANTGIISGTPAALGIYAVSLTASNGLGASLPQSVSFEVLPSLPMLLTGAASGSSAWASSSQWDFGKAIDGLTSNFFAPEGPNSFVQIARNLSDARVTMIRYFPRSGFEARMSGAVFQGSNDLVNWSSLHTVVSTPALRWHEVDVTHDGTFRYLRYLHPSLGDAAEVEFRGSIQTNSLTGIQQFRADMNLAPDGSQDRLEPGADGVSNLLKYAFNLIGTGLGQTQQLDQPNNTVWEEGKLAGLPRVSLVESGKWQIDYIRRKVAGMPGIRYEVEFSKTLQQAEWLLEPAVVEIVTSLNASIERVSLVMTTEDLACFFRIRVVAE
ncbi:MAG: hypothetical protein EAZ42_13345 [Verrucomicrobia bacterium]|nr:MAG: hypothetical protein EAZ42_13345 [Verrucomicrobiota bacterium]